MTKSQNIPTQTNTMTNEAQYSGIYGIRRTAADGSVKKYVEKKDNRIKQDDTLLGSLWCDDDT